MILRPLLERFLRRLAAAYLHPEDLEYSLHTVAWMLRDLMPGDELADWLAGYDAWRACRRGSARDSAGISIRISIGGADRDDP
jgi:hypothetical protein